MSSALLSCESRWVRVGLRFGGRVGDHIIQNLTDPVALFFL